MANRQAREYAQAFAAAVAAALLGALLAASLAERLQAPPPLWLQVVLGVVPVHLFAAGAALMVLARKRGPREASGGPDLPGDEEAGGAFVANCEPRKVSVGFVLLVAGASYAATVLIVLGTAGILEVLGLPVRGNPLMEAVVASGGPPAWAALAITSLLVAPFAEEFLFREVLFAALLPAGARVAAVASALLFSAVHGVPSQLLALFGLGLLLQWVRRRAGGRLGPCIAVHAAYNGIALLLAAALAGSS